MSKGRPSESDILRMIDRDNEKMNRLEDKMVERRELNYKLSPQSSISPSPENTGSPVPGLSPENTGSQVPELSPENTGSSSSELSSQSSKSPSPENTGTPFPENTGSPSPELSHQPSTSPFPGHTYLTEDYNDYNDSVQSFLPIVDILSTEVPVIANLLCIYYKLYKLDFFKFLCYIFIFK